MMAEIENGIPGLGISQARLEQSMLDALKKVGAWGASANGLCYTYQKLGYEVDIIRITGILNRLVSEGKVEQVIRKGSSKVLAKPVFRIKENENV